MRWATSSPSALLPRGPAGGHLDLTCFALALVVGALQHPARDVAAEVKASAAASAIEPRTSVYVVTTMSCAIFSCSRIMNVAIVAARIEAAVATTLPVGVSPMSRVASVATPAEIARRRGRSRAQRSRSVCRPIRRRRTPRRLRSRATAAIETKARKRTQNAIRPISRDGLAATFETTPGLPGEEVRSSPARVSPVVRSFATNFAMK